MIFINTCSKNRVINFTFQYHINILVREGSNDNVHENVNENVNENGNGNEEVFDELFDMMEKFTQRIVNIENNL